MIRGSRFAQDAVAVRRVMVAGSGLLGLLLAACGPVPGSLCNQGQCPPGRVCDLSTGICLADQPPQVAIRTPSTTDVLKGGSTLLSGFIWDDGTVKYAEYRVAGDAGSWVPLTLDADGGYSELAAVPPRDGAPMLFEVRAWDDQNLIGEGTITPEVDNVAPSGIFSPADGTHDTGRFISLVFSEPVTTLDGGPPFVLDVDAGPGAWDSLHQTFTYGPLAYDTGYTATYPVRSVLDRFGNVNVDGGVARIWTEPAAPDSGLVWNFGTDTVNEISAASDEDGVTTLVAQATTTGGSNYYLWGSFDPKTGGFQRIDSPAGGSAFYAVADRAIQADLSALRMSGFYLVNNSAGVATFTRIGSQAPQEIGNGTTEIVIPAPAPCDSNSSDVATLVVNDGGAPTLQRNGAVFGFNPFWAGVRSPEDWQVFAVGSSGLETQRFDAICPSGPAGGSLGPVTSLLSPVLLPFGAVSATPSVSLAIARGAPQIEVSYFSNIGSRSDACLDCRTGTCVSQVTAVPPGENLQLAPLGMSSSVLGARRNTTTHEVELLQRDLGQGCGSSWQVIASVPDSGTATEWVPAMFGNKPGVLLQQAHEVDVYVP